MSLNHPALNALIPVILLVSLGYLAGRVRWIRADATRDLANLVFLVLTPALMFRTMSTVHVQDLDFRPLLLYFAAAMVLFVTRGGESQFEAIHLVPAVAMLGFALGISIAVTIAFVLSEVPHEFAGAASGVQATGLQLAGAIGIAVIGLAYWGQIGDSEAESVYINGINAVMWISIALAVIQAALVFLLPRHNAKVGEEFLLADPELLVMPDLHGDKA